MTDPWDRVYAFTTDGVVNHHRYQFIWKDADAVLAVEDITRNPPASFVPSLMTGGKGIGSGVGTEPQVTLVKKSSALIPAPPFCRVNTAPTFSLGSWSGGDMDILTIEVDPPTANINLNHVPVAWEIKPEEFSTPLPTWPWLQIPTHFFIDKFSCIRFCSNDVTDISTRSIEIPFLGRQEANANPPSGALGPVKMMAGPPLDRLCPWRFSVDTSAYTSSGHNMVWRRAGDGKLLAFGNASFSHYLSGNYMNAHVMLHRNTRPVFRARSYGIIGASFAVNATWTIDPYGVYGVGTPITVSAPWVNYGSPYYQGTLDTTLDLNTVTLPAGTSHVFVHIDTVVPSDFYCMSGAQPTDFPPSGTLSGVKESVYIPGRLIDVGTVTDAGVAS